MKIKRTDTFYLILDSFYSSASSIVFLIVKRFFLHFNFNASANDVVLVIICIIHILKTWASDSGPLDQYVIAAQKNVS